MSQATSPRLQSLRRPWPQTASEAFSEMHPEDVWGRGVRRGDVSQSSLSPSGGSRARNKACSCIFGPVGSKKQGPLPPRSGKAYFSSKRAAGFCILNTSGLRSPALAVLVLKDVTSCQPSPRPSAARSSSSFSALAVLSDPTTYHEFVRGRGAPWTMSGSSWTPGMKALDACVSFPSCPAGPAAGGQGMGTLLF